MLIEVKGGDIVYLIINGGIKKARVIEQIAGKKFLVSLLSTSEKVRVEYGNEMFLTYKKARSEFQIMIQNISSIEEKAKSMLLSKTAKSQYIICDMCGSVSTSGKNCQCRYGH